MDNAQLLSDLDVMIATISADIHTVKGDVSCLKGLAQSVQQTVQVVRVEAVRTREHVTLEHEQTRNMIIRGVVENRDSMINAMDKDKAKRIQEEHQDQTRQAFMKRLEFPNMNTRADKIHDTHGDTFSWIFNASKNRISIDDSDSSSSFEFGETECDFGEWLGTNAGGRIYWISGKLGSGKSSLMKLIATHPGARKLLEAWATPKTYLIITHYFWAAGTDEQKGVLGMLRSILYQLIKTESTLSDQLITFLQHEGYISNDYASIETWNMSRQNLELALKYTLERVEHSHKVFYLLDGLDEFADEQYNTQDLFKLIDTLLEMCEGSRVCVSSRPEPAFQRRYENTKQLKLENLTRNDMMQYVGERLSLHDWAMDLMEEDETRFIRLLEGLIEKAQGVFLWLALVLKDLEAGFESEDSFDLLEERVTALPATLKLLYQGMMGKVDKVHYPETAFLLNFMLAHNLHRSVLSLLDIAVMRWLFNRKAMEHLDEKSAKELCNELENQPNKRVRELKHTVGSRCLGLVECTTTDRGRGLGRAHGDNIASDNSFEDLPWGFLTDLDLEHRKAISTLYDSEAVGFIHRSAAEFIREDEGVLQFISANLCSTARITQLYVDYILSISTTMSWEPDRKPSDPPRFNVVRQHWTAVLFQDYITDDLQACMFDRVDATIAAFQQRGCKWIFMSLYPRLICSALQLASVHGLWSYFGKHRDFHPQNTDVTCLLYLAACGLAYHSRTSDHVPSCSLFSKYNQWACNLYDSSAPMIGEKDVRGFLNALSALMSRGALSSAASTNEVGVSRSNNDTNETQIGPSEIWKTFVSANVVPKLVWANKDEEAATALKNCVEAFQEAGIDTHMFVGKWALFPVNDNLRVAVYTASSAAELLQQSCCDQDMARHESLHSRHLYAMEITLTSSRLTLYLEFEATSAEGRAQLHRSLLPKGQLHNTPESLVKIWDTASTRSLVLCPQMKRWEERSSDYRINISVDETLPRVAVRSWSIELDIFGAPDTDFELARPEPIPILYELMTYELDIKLLQRYIDRGGISSYNEVGVDFEYDDEELRNGVWIYRYTFRPMSVPNSSDSETHARGTVRVPPPALMDAFKENTYYLSAAAILALRQECAPLCVTTAYDALTHTTVGRRGIVTAIRNICVRAFNTHFRTNLRNEFRTMASYDINAESDRYIEHLRSKLAQFDEECSPELQALRDWSQHSHQKYLDYSSLDDDVEPSTRCTSTPMSLSTSVRLTRAMAS